MTIADLKEKQSWTLSQKIDHSLGVIDQFIGITKGQAYVSFSGGKDSTVLLDLCRIINPNIKAVFCNTGNEFPDIVKFVRSFDNVEIIYPKLRPQDIISKYGFPLISKEQSSFINEARTTKSDKLRNIRINGRGVGGKRGNSCISKKWLFLLGKDYMCSDKCCDKLKKDPFKKYEKQTGLRPILGTMASESSLRASNYVRHGGCNIFKDDPSKIKSMPLSIWTDDDIWSYIKYRKLEISDIYKKGADRTGCMFCGFGAHIGSDNRFDMIFKLYPKMYNRFMSYENNGITYREAITDVISVHNKYLPDQSK